MTTLTADNLTDAVTKTRELARSRGRSISERRARALVIETSLLEAEGLNAQPHKAQRRNRRNNRQRFGR